MALVVFEGPIRLEVDKKDFNLKLYTLGIRTTDLKIMETFEILRFKKDFISTLTQVFIDETISV